MTIDHHLLEKTLGLLCTVQVFSLLQLCGLQTELAVIGACATYLLAQPVARHLWTMRPVSSRA